MNDLSKIPTIELLKEMNHRDVKTDIELSHFTLVQLAAEMVNRTSSSVAMVVIADNRNTDNLSLAVSPHMEAEDIAELFTDGAMFVLGDD